VFDTAIIAGVMAAKRTHEIIPFCHPLALERCSVDIASGANGRIRIVCNVAVHHKTGVEMEALMGVTAAALTIYDMCKALSHDIEIGPVKLIRKSGGKRDFQRLKLRKKS
jgi:cyclic pyranopterin phosphate synthase